MLTINITITTVHGPVFLDWKHCNNQTFERLALLDIMGALLDPAETLQTSPHYDIEGFKGRFFSLTISDARGGEGPFNPYRET